VVGSGGGASAVVDVGRRLRCAPATRAGARARRGGARRRCCGCVPAASVRRPRAAERSAPDGYTTAEWVETAAGIARLDIEAVDQLVAGTAAPLRAVPGLHEYLMPSHVDHTWQLVAMYVPANAP